jgi:hypothetical protein
MELANAPSPTQTTLLFSKLWAPKKAHRQSIAEALITLAEILKGDLSKPIILEGYIAVMTPASPAQCIQAFSRALETCKFFPSPAELRGFSSLPNAIDLIKLEAMASLRFVADAVSRHGVDLRPAKGPILNDGRDAQGLVMMIPDRGPSIPAPELTKRQLHALRLVGYGTIADGLRRVTSLLRYIEEEQAGNGQYGATRDRLRLEAEWCAAYAQEE